MAAKLSNQALKLEALRALEEGREEISIEVRRARVELSPRRVARGVLRKHTVGVMVGAVGAGIGLALLVFRRRTLPALPPQEQASKAEQAKPKHTLFKTILEFAGPLVLNKLVAPYLTNYLAKRDFMPRADSPSHSDGDPSSNDFPA
jgi:hypothetical protein